MTAPAARKDPLGALVAGIEQWLSELDDEQFAQLVARVRPPADDNPTDKPKPDDGPAYPASWGTK